MTPLIALTGYARTGKDRVADVLVAEYGYQKRSIGDIIKRDLLYFAQDPAAAHFVFYDWLRDNGHGAESVRNVTVGLRHARDLLTFVPFDPLVRLYGITDHEKQFLRPVLEEYVNWRYEEIMREYFATLPSPCVNNRLCRLEEAREWKARGGQIWLVTRPGFLPATEQEARWVDDLANGGFIDWTITNGDTLPVLQECVRDLITISEGYHEATRTKGTPHEQDY